MDFIYLIGNNCRELIGSVHPKIKIVAPWNSVVLTCYSNGDLRWIRDGQVISTSPVMEILSAADKHHGKYFCKGLDLNNREFLAASTVIVACKSFILANV